LFKSLVLASAVLAASGLSASALDSINSGALVCSVSAGVGMGFMQRQALRCVFNPIDGGPAEAYTGRIDQYGVAVGVVGEGNLVWAVLAPSSGVPRHALAGSYAGVGAQITPAVGVGANVLVGGLDRAFSLQPLSLQGQVGVDISAGMTKVTLIPERSKAAAFRPDLLEY
jgi:hypothetical protein